MRVSREEKDRSRQRIIGCAATSIRKAGLSGSGIGDVMRLAGMTHGGFYRHFGDRDELLEVSVEAAVDESIERLAAGLRKAGPGDGMERLVALYLSDQHVRNPAKGCPLPAIGSEVGHASPKMKKAYGKGVARMLDLLGQQSDGPGKEADRAAALALAQMVGAVLIARACDAAQAKAFLALVRDD